MSYGKGDDSINISQLSAIDFLARTRSTQHFQLFQLLSTNKLNDSNILISVKQSFNQLVSSPNTLYSNLLSGLLYGIPSFLIIYILWYFYKENKDIIKESKKAIILIFIVSFVYTSFSLKNDVYFLTLMSSNKIDEALLENMELLKNNTTITSFLKCLMFSSFLTVGELRYRGSDRDSKIKILANKIIIFATLFTNINFSFIIIAYFAYFNITYGNKNNKLDNILSVFFMFIEEFVLNNSYFFLVILFYTSFKNFKLKESKDVVYFERTEWKNELNLIEKSGSEYSYLFIIFSQKLSSKDKKEFICFLRNITHEEKIIRVHDDIYVIGFSKIDKNFGVTDVYVNEMTRSNIETLKELISRRLIFLLTAENNCKYDYKMYESENFMDYKQLKERFINYRKKLNGLKIHSKKLNRNNKEITGENNNINKDTNNEENIIEENKNI